MSEQLHQKEISSNYLNSMLKTYLTPKQRAAAKFIIGTAILTGVACAAYYGVKKGILKDVGTQEIRSAMPTGSLYQSNSLESRIL